MDNLKRIPSKCTYCDGLQLVAIPNGIDDCDMEYCPYCTSEELGDVHTCPHGIPFGEECSECNTEATTDIDDGTLADLEYMLYNDK